MVKLSKGVRGSWSNKHNVPSFRLRLSLAVWNWRAARACTAQQQQQLTDYLGTIEYYWARSTLVGYFCFQRPGAVVFLLTNTELAFTWTALGKGNDCLVLVGL